MISEEYWLDHSYHGEHDEMHSAVNAFNYDLEKEMESLMTDPLFQEFQGLEQQQQMPYSSFYMSPMDAPSQLSLSDETDAFSASVVPTSMELVLPVPMLPVHAPPLQSFPPQQRDTGLRVSILEDDFPVEQNFASPFSEDGFAQWFSSPGSSDGSSSTSVATKQQKSRRTGGANGRSMEELSKMDPVKVKRILSNRASAARSKQRRKQEMEYLQNQARFLTQENERLLTQVQQMDWTIRESAQDVEQKRIQIANLQNNIAALNLSNDALEARLPSAMKQEQSDLRSMNDDCTSLLNNDAMMDYANEGPPISMAYQAFFVTSSPLV